MKTVGLMQKDEPERRVNLLSVEDNPADERLLRELLKQCRTHVDVHSVPNGVEAMNYLRRKGSYAGASRPDIILLDLNMPQKDGRAVLKEIKEDIDLREIPVIILTTSSSQSDINEMYSLYANTYLTKPVDLTKFECLVSAIDDFWFHKAQLPDHEEGFSPNAR